MRERRRKAAGTGWTSHTRGRGARFFPRKRGDGRGQAMKGPPKRCECRLRSVTPFRPATWRVAERSEIARPARAGHSAAGPERVGGENDVCAGGRMPGGTD